MKVSLRFAPRSTPLALGTIAVLASIAVVGSELPKLRVNAKGLLLPSLTNGVEHVPSPRPLQAVDARVWGPRFQIYINTLRHGIAPPGERFQYIVRGHRNAPQIIGEQVRAVAAGHADALHRLLKANPRWDLGELTHEQLWQLVFNNHEVARYLESAYGGADIGDLAEFYVPPFAPDQPYGAQFDRYIQPLIDFYMKRLASDAQAHVIAVEPGKDNEPLLEVLWRPVKRFPPLLAGIALLEHDPPHPSPEVLWKPLVNYFHVVPFPKESRGRFLPWKDTNQPRVFNSLRGLMGETRARQFLDHY